MQAGRLRHRVTIQEESVTRDGIGGEVVTWQDIATAPTVWAEVAATEGTRIGEQFVNEAASFVARSFFRVRMRYRSDVSAKNRIIHDGRPLDIHSVFDAQGRYRELRLICSEIAA